MRTCDCPTRETALMPPEWPATGIASREELEKILVEHYQSSTFNYVQVPVAASHVGHTTTRTAQRGRDATYSGE